MGMTAGVWMARIPAVKAQAGLSDAALGASGTAGAKARVRSG
jgi:hypothetical protein